MYKLIYFMLYSNMVKSKSKSSYKESFLYCNVLILLGLVIVCYYLNKDDDEYEGISNMNCCGGIEAGIHYSETDTKPPHYVQRCFQSDEDGSYKWSGFPCTGKDSDDCCSTNGKNGTCIASTKGGYCTSDEGDFYFGKRQGSSTRSYIKHSSDNIIDVNDTNDMKDYYYARSDTVSTKYMSKEMKQFMNRRSKNESYMQQQLVNKNKKDDVNKEAVTSKLQDRKKNVQIIYSLTIIHLLFIVIFSIVIRELIIQKIDGFYQLIYLQVLKFQGKTV
jgi:hypothetical protein